LADDIRKMQHSSFRLDPGRSCETARAVADARIAKSPGPTPALDYAALEAVREW